MTEIERLLADGWREDDIWGPPILVDYQDMINIRMVIDGSRARVFWRPAPIPSV